MKFGLILRAYAPFEMFGGPFHGDGRGPTTASNVTSRIKSWVEFDPITGVLGSPHAKSDESRLAFEMPIFNPRATAISFARVSALKTDRSSILFRMHAWGANPLMHGVAPDIDMHLTICVSYAPGRLDVTADLTGDRFPNIEAMLQDEGGTRRMIASFETDAGAHIGPLRLFNDKQATMNAICKSFPLTEAGRFR